MDNPLHEGDPVTFTQDASLPVETPTTDVPLGDEMAQAFEEQVTGDAEPPAQDEMDALTETGVALEWLRDLSYTVSKEGVSSADVKMLMDIRAKAIARGLHLPTCTSLETYGVNGFTESRSHLNLNVSQEGILQTIADMVKAWVKQFKDWLIKTVRHLRNQQHMDEQVKKKVDKIVQAVEDAAAACRAARNMSPGKRAHTEELNKYAAEVVQTFKNLKRNDVTLAFLGDLDKWQKVKEVRGDAHRGVALLKRTMADFKLYQQGVGEQSGVNFQVLTSLKQANSSADAMLVQNPNAQAIKNWMDAMDHEAFETPLLHEQKDFVSYEFILTAMVDANDLVRNVEKQLPEIAKFDEGIASETTTVLNHVNAAYLELYKLIDFFVEVRRTQVAALTLYYSYWNKALTVAYGDLTLGTLAGDHMLAAVDKLIDKARASARAVGVT